MNYLNDDKDPGERGGVPKFFMLSVNSYCQKVFRLFFEIGRGQDWFLRFA